MSATGLVATVLGRLVGALSLSFVLLDCPFATDLVATDLVATVLGRLIGARSCFVPDDDAPALFLTICLSTAMWRG